jgi:hypothetical protein
LNANRTKVVLTRKRWDAYMMPLFVASFFLGGYTAWRTGQPRFYAAPFPVLLMWVMLRFTTPREGMAVTTIRSTPGAVVMLSFCAAAMLLMVTLSLVDIYVLDHPMDATLEPYHVLLYAPPFIVMLSGACWADRIAKAARARDME